MLSIFPSVTNLRFFLKKSWIGMEFYYFSVSWFFLYFLNVLLRRPALLTPLSMLYKSFIDSAEFYPLVFCLGSLNERNWPAIFLFNINRKQNHVNSNLTTWFQRSWFFILLSSIKHRWDNSTDKGKKNLKPEHWTLDKTGTVWRRRGGRQSLNLHLTQGAIISNSSCWCCILKTLGICVKSQGDYREPLSILHDL